MSDSNTLSLQEVFCEVLENLAFMFGDPAACKDLPCIDEPVLEAAIGFQGPTRGSLTLLAPQSLAVELAANVLGIDPEDESAVEQGRDALGELMNVTLGRLLTTVAGDAPVFDLTPPQVSEVEHDRWNEFAQAPDVVAVVIDDKPVLLRLHTEASVPLDLIATPGSEQ